MGSVKFDNHIIQVKSTMSELAQIAVEEACGELESQTKRNNDRYVDTGQTKNAWVHRVKSTDEECMGTVGNSLENSIWEEFGTGDYALNGDGRKGGWFYVDEEGHGHFTHGKKPRRPFWNAYTSLKSKLIKHMQDIFKGGLS